MKKIAALTEDVVRRLRPRLMGYSGKFIKEILVKELPGRRGFRRNWQIAISKKPPTTEQLSALVHETIHTSALEQLWRLRRKEFNSLRESKLLGSYGI